MKSLMLKVALILMTVLVGSSVALAAGPPSSCGQSGTTGSPQGILQNACTQDASLAGCGASDQQVDNGCGSKASNNISFLEGLLNTFFLAAGTVAVIFIIMGGIRYMTSTGDATRIKQAKDTILYGIIGLIVTILAVPISGFVVNKVAGG